MMDDQNNGQMRDATKGPNLTDDTEEEDAVAQEPARHSRRRVRLYVGQRLIAVGEALLRQPWDAAAKPDYDAEPSRG